MTVRQAGAAHSVSAFAEPGTEDADRPAETFRQESGLLAAAVAV
ncbi:hypothetical protein ACFY6U_25845 [Streptomyces sp. NPDC013157]